MTAWTDFVKKTHAIGMASDPSFSLKMAMKQASKEWKKSRKNTSGGNNTVVPSSVSSADAANPPGTDVAIADVANKTTDANKTADAKTDENKTADTNKTADAKTDANATKMPAAAGGAKTKRAKRTVTKRPIGSRKKKIAK